VEEAAMEYRTILVQAGFHPADEARLAIARELGARNRAHVIGVGASAWAPFLDTGVGYGGAEAFTTLMEDVDADVAEAETRFRAIFSGYAGSTEWRARIDFPAPVLAAAARAADILVASQVRGRRDHRRTPAPERLVLECGVPVLLCPPEAARLDLDAIVVGWKKGREARHALADALPLLKQARRIVLASAAAPDARQATEAELREVIAGLGRHGVRAESEVLDAYVDDPAEMLFDLARRDGAGLIVAGAYGHTRLREWVLGGVTQALIERAPIPVLFSR
jgi:nucleotide-binding universal stress UspA family protein